MSAPVQKNVLVEKSVLVEKGVLAAPAGERPAPRIGKKVIRGTVAGSYDRAREVLAEAHREADAIRARARAEARALRRRTIERAYSHCLARWQSRLAAVDDVEQDLYRTLRPQLVELSLSIASRLVRRRVEVEPGLLEGLVEDGLRALQGAAGERILVRVHPASRAGVEELLERLRTKNPRWQSMTAVGDESVELGGCKIESEAGRVDATLDTQLRALRQALRLEGTSP